MVSKHLFAHIDIEIECYGAGDDAETGRNNSEDSHSLLLRILEKECTGFGHFRLCRLRAMRIPVQRYVRK